MRVALGQFACTGIEAHIGDDIPTGVRKALFHYAAKLKAGRCPIEVPRFLADQDGYDAVVDFELTVDAETEAMLEREAQRQQTTTTELVAHTVLTYLAEIEFLDSSRVLRAL
jgi:hypothetical protein